ncbi:VanW family protein [Deinococcus peraridilitoris]|uniref:VanW family protein n=1 Tax=Deinococcus peraridilitoris TaxID=432329 RepID=UPI000A0409B3|nr:VanW family protein [Deinococcus peraridilitoris]
MKGPPAAPSSTPSRRPLVWLGVALLTTTALSLTVATRDEAGLPDGTTVAGVVLSGLTPHEAQLRLEAAELRAPQVTVRAGDQSWLVDGAQLGWRVDAAATVRELQAGLGSVLNRTVARLSGRGPSEGRLVVQIDPTLAKSKLDALTGPFQRAPQDAEIYFDSSARRYAWRADRSGVIFDTQQATNDFLGHPQQFELTVPFTVRHASFTSDEAQVVVGEGNRLMRPLSLKLVGSSRQLQLTPTQVANLYWVRPHGIELDHKTIAEAVDRTSRQVGQPALDARFVPQHGRLVPQKEQTGLVSAKSAAAMLRQAVMRPEVQNLTLPSETVLPSLTVDGLPDPAKLSVIGEGRSGYLGSSAQRVTNVNVAARKLSGYVVAPGEDFSFLSAIGRINADSGYASALVIAGGRTVEGVGGGVCQVSTTAFRALYSAGLPVVERHQHAYRVGWYNPQVGFEAAVYDPGLDLRMKNDTGGPLLIRAFNDPQKGQLVVRLYGVAQQRKVSVGPAVILSRTPAPAPQYVVNPHLAAGQRRQVDWAADGYNLYITRTITDAGGQHTEKLSTTYKPWRAVYEVGQAPVATPPPPWNTTKPPVSSKPTGQS